jgi:hypothetical protein
MDLPETIALHRTLNEFQPEVIVDAHEFSVATRWIQKIRLAAVLGSDADLCHES